MLIKCPECELQASDKAAVCPHCGYPFQKDIKPRRPRKSNKRRRLPNGFGQISEIKGRNLRNPFRAMITVGKTAKGRPICKPLKPQSFFPTYNDAYAALVEYNKNPYDLDPSITVKELYEKWSDEHFKTLASYSSIKTIRAAWNYCSSIYDMRVVDVRSRHIKGCMEEGYVMDGDKKKYASANMKGRIKTLYNLMLDYALVYEFVDRNYARSFNISEGIKKEVKENTNNHIAFTDEEMNILWSRVDDVPYVDAILIGCYSGWRPEELVTLTLENIDLENGTMFGGSKTEAGINRTVPIHSKIRHLVEKNYKNAEILGSKYLINCIDKRFASDSLEMTYNKYRKRFIKIRNNLGLSPEHKCHDTRKHFITTAKKYKVDEYAIKRMVGHAITDITESVYTERSVDWLKEEIEKIK